MRILKGTVTSKRSLPASPPTRLIELTLDHNKRVLLQTYVEAPIAENDQLVVGGFQMLWWFAVMTYKNQSNGHGWSNNLWPIGLLGVFVASMPLFTSASSVQGFTWVDLVFVLVGLGLVAFAANIFMVTKRVLSESSRSDPST